MELSDSGMKISCIYETFDFGRNKDISEGKRMIEAAAEMKAPRILVIPGNLKVGKQRNCLPAVMTMIPWNNI